ncbi:MAG TPA: HNH endonuclease, partial [Verrucomicrobiota bacterium]|nr:HNH endonuclease [Verrucomicrobiota bacterium]
MGSLLEQNVLVLNRLWQAVNVCSVRRALTLLFSGHAQV